MNEIKKLRTQTRIRKLNGKNPVGNMRIINKLKRQLRRLENEK